MINLDSPFKGRDVTLLTKVHTVKAMVFLVVMDRCESWTIKKAQCWRTEAFELWYWRRCLRVPWTPRRSNQSILKEISPEYSLEGLMLKLKWQYFGHLIQRADSLEKTLMLGKIEDTRRWGQQRMRWLDSITHSTGLSLSKFREIQGSLACYSPWSHKELDMTWPLNNSNNTCIIVFKSKLDKVLCLCLVAQSCQTLCNATNCSPSGSSVHGTSPSKNIGVNCHALLQEIFPTQGSNPGLPHCRQILYHLSHQGSPS